MTSFEFWLPIICTNLPLLAAYCCGFGILLNKVKQLEKRMDCNGGVSIPSQCYVHEQRLDEHDRRLNHLETTE